MKILIVSEYFPQNTALQFSGGVESRNFYIAKHLAKNHKVTVLTSRLKNTKEKEQMYGFYVRRVGHPQAYHAAAGSIFSRINFIINAAFAGRAIKSDIVEGTNFITHFIAFIIGSMQKIPVVAWYPDVWLGNWIKNSGPLGLTGEILERINLKLGFAKYIAISNETKKKLEKYTKADIAIIPCGIEESEFKSRSIKKEPIILCISRLVKYKRIKDLILAFALIHKENKTLKLIIIGSGPEENKLIDLAVNIKINKQVKFLSNIKRIELIRLLHRSKIFCLPSEVEGFGISVLEAAAANTPYIVSDIPVFKEITKDFKGGLQFKAGNINDLKSKLQKLLTEKDLYDKKKVECNTLSRYYSWKKIAKLTENEYFKLTNIANG